jgi:hypothetical protein
MARLSLESNRQVGLGAPAELKKMKINCDVIYLYLRKNHHLSSSRLTPVLI